MKQVIATGLLALLAACAYVPPACHNSGEDYTGADACR